VTAKAMIQQALPGFYAQPTRALSLTQPYAWAVAQGIKSIENRTWWSMIRGPIWIASSQQVRWAYYREARDLIERVSGVQVPRLDDLPCGYIVGRASIVDCILPGGYTVITTQQAQGARKLYQARLDAAALGQSVEQLKHPGPRHSLHPHPFHFLDQYGYVLEDQRPVPKPVPCSGHQRWWDVPADVLAALAEQDEAPR